MAFLIYILIEKNNLLIKQHFTCCYFGPSPSTTTPPPPQPQLLLLLPNTNLDKQQQQPPTPPPQPTTFTLSWPEIINLQTQNPSTSLHHKPQKSLFPSSNPETRLATHNPEPHHRFLPLNLIQHRNPPENHNPETQYTLCSSTSSSLIPPSPNPKKPKS